MKHARTSWRRLGRVVAVTMLGVVPLMLSSCSGSSGGSAASPITQVGGPAQTNPRYPGAFIFPRPYPMPDVTLTDTSGAPYDIGSHTAATVTLLYFGYTHCPDLCPLNMATTASAIEGLPRPDRDRVRVVFVTTDPNRDTPTVIRTWLDHFDTRFVGLTGSIEAIRQAEQAAGVPFAVAGQTSGPGSSYQVVHAGFVLVYTQDGKVHAEFPAEIRAGQEAQDLIALLAQGWKS